jgi:hypothetical protein
MEFKIQQVINSFLLLLLPSICQSQLSDIPDGTDTSLVYPGQAVAVDSSSHWQYRKYSFYDLDGDGIQEKIVILANVELSSNGEPAWDDGQRWEVRIEEPAGTKTRVFAQYVQFGEVQGYITNQDGQLALLLLEKSSNYLRGSEVIYLGPNKIKSRVIFSRGYRTTGQHYKYSRVRLPNNSLNLTEALARWLRRAQAAAPRTNVQWTRGCATAPIGHSAAG